MLRNKVGIAHYGKCLCVDIKPDVRKLKPIKLKFNELSERKDSNGEYSVDLPKSDINSVSSDKKNDMNTE